MKDPTSLAIGLIPEVQYEIRQMMHRYIGHPSGQRLREDIAREANGILRQHLMAGYPVLEVTETDRD